MKPSFYPHTFKVGDLVEATSPIWRTDRRTTLLPGQRARVSQVSRVDPSQPQIIAIDVPHRLPIGDLVCFDTLPLRLVVETKT